MNIAFPALFIFVLALPGFLFWNLFTRAEKTSLDNQPFGNTLVRGFVTAAALHALWCLLAYVLFGTRPDVDAVLSLLVGDKSAHMDRALDELGRDPLRPFAYFATLYAAAGMLGTGLRALIVKLKLDRRDHALAGLFRFATPWYYLFNGYDEDVPPDAVAISAVVELGGEPYLYVGILEEYFLDANGQPERLVLSLASRRPLARDRNTERRPAETERFYPIDGTYLVLRYSETVTLNVKYIYLVDAEEPETFDDREG